MSTNKSPRLPFEIVITSKDEDGKTTIVFQDTICAPTVQMAEIVAIVAAARADGDFDPEGVQVFNKSFQG